MLSTLLRLLGLAFFASLVAGCGDKQPWITLPHDKSLAYELSIATFKDTDSIAQPFKLRVAPISQQERAIQILSAEQCKNVEVFQDRENIAIFYDDLVLDQFSGYDLGPRIPRPLICDNHSLTCQAVRKEFAREGKRGVAVCALR